MKKIHLAFLLSLVSLALPAQNADPVVMHINGKPVTRSEFEYSYNKNNSDGVIDKKTVKDYVPLFVAYKLKVEAASSVTSNDSKAEIRINGRDYALNKAGLNVVVFNPSSGEMVDSSVISLSDGSDSLSHQ